jgi:hypothetical protein
VGGKPVIRLFIDIVKYHLFTGSRNGGIKLYDLRMNLLNQQRPGDLLGSYHSKIHSTISGLEVVGEWQLLVSGTNHQVTQIADLPNLYH